MPNYRFYLLPLLVFVLALGVRLYYVNVVPQVPVRFDASSYLQLGQDLVQSPDWRNDADLWVQNAPRFQLNPGYSFLLAGIISTVGEESIRNVQALFGAITALFIYGVGTLLHSQRVGFLAGVGFALHPTFALYSGLMLSETGTFPFLWASFYTFVLGMKQRRAGWIVLSALCMLLSLIMRVSLLPILPLFVYATYKQWDGTLKARLILSAVLFVVVMGGYFLYRRVWLHPPVELFVYFDTLETLGIAFVKGHHPDLQGWSGHAYMSTPDYLLNPFHMATSILNHLFYGLWYADITYFATWGLSIAQMHALQGLLLLLTLVGITLSLPKWRKHMILYAIIVATIAQTPLLYIETRHSIFAYTTFFIYATIAIDALMMARRLRVVVLSISLVVGAVALYIAPLPTFILTSTLPAMLLGYLKDGLLLCAILGLIAVNIALMGYPQTRREWRRVSALPVLFALITGGHLLANSNLRWQSWHADASVFPHGIQQTIQLAQPINAIADETNESTAWLLIDVQHLPEYPTLSLAINGAPIETTWIAVFCVPYDPDRCIYPWVVAQQNKTISDYPQWIRVPIDIALISHVDELVITLHDLDGVPLRGTYHAIEGGYRGVSVQGQTAEIMTSLYRFPVLEDWRLLTYNELASTRTTSAFLGADGTPMPMSGTFSIHLVILENGVFLRYY